LTYKFEEQLGSRPVAPLVFSMATPAVVAQLVNLLYSIVDRIYIGHIPVTGTDALAGIGMTSAVLLLISAFAQLVGGGGAPLAATALGAGDRDKARRLLGSGFVLLILFSVLTMVPVYLFMKPILRFAGASGPTMDYAAEYLSVYLIGTPFVMVTAGLNPFINCQGRTGISMCSVLIGAALNIALDPIFIFTFGMGVAGAAAATVISQACSAAWTLLFLFSQRASLRISPAFMRLDRKVVGPILALGLSPFIMNSTESIMGFVLNSNLAKFGTIYVSALTVAQSSMMFVSVPLNGFGQGVTPIISYNYGHGNVARVKKAFRVSLATMFSVNLTLFLLMILFPSAVARIFTDDPALIRTVSEILPVFLAGITIFGMQRACQNAFVALGQTRASLFIALLRKVILLIPLACILPHFMGYMGVYAAEAIGDGTAAICCMILFLVRFPKILAGAPKAPADEKKKG